MSWKPRGLEPDELDEFIDLSATMFHVGPIMPDAYRRQVKLGIEIDRTFVIDDGPILAGTAGAYSLEMALPGGGSVAMCGVTEVGVLPTHRRRGMLRALMEAVLDQAVERDEPVAGLTASEGSIYRRFGFGVAARFQRITVDRARSAELLDLRAPGTLRLISEAEAVEALPAVWERHWRRLPGEVRRDTPWWQSLAIDPEEDRDGASARFLVAHEDPEGRPDGFAIYRLKEGAAADGRSELKVEDLAAADDQVEATLLRYLLDVDLVGHLAWRAPVDLSLRWRLVDPRAIQVIQERDLLWLRPLDVPRCLAARTYAAEGGGVLEVGDRFRPEVGGRFALDAGPDGAECARTRADPDLVLDSAELGALLLGGVSWATLHRAGLVEERTPGAVDRFDTLFRPRRAPYCGSPF